MSEFVLSDFQFSPVKSGAMRSARSVELTSTGIRGDRQFMVVTTDDAGNHRRISQLEHPHLARLHSNIYFGSNVLQLWLPDNDDGPNQALHTMVFDPEQRDGEPIETAIYGHAVTGLDQGPEVGQWLEETLQLPGARLLQASADHPRHMRTPYRNGEHSGGVTFADRSTLSLASMGSLRAVQARLAQVGTPVDQQALKARFRTNLWVEISPTATDDGPKNAEPFDEDFWWQLEVDAKVGSEPTILMEVVRAIARCAIIETDHRRGERHAQPHDARVLKALGRLGRTGTDPITNEAGIFFAQQVTYSMLPGQTVQLSEGNVGRVINRDPARNFKIPTA